MEEDASAFDASRLAALTEEELSGMLSWRRPFPQLAERARLLREVRGPALSSLSYLSPLHFLSSFLVSSSSFIGYSSACLRSVTVVQLYI